MCVRPWLPSSAGSENHQAHKALKLLLPYSEAQAGSPTGVPRPGLGNYVTQPDPPPVRIQHKPSRGQTPPTKTPRPCKYLVYLSRETQRFLKTQITKHEGLTCHEHRSHLPYDRNPDHYYQYLQKKASSGAERGGGFSVDTITL